MVRARPLLIFSILMTLALLAVFFWANPAERRLGSNFRAQMHTRDWARIGDLPGDYRLVYFGYLSCPDVCLTAALSIGGALRTLETTHPDLRARITNVFVTLDPDVDVIDGPYNAMAGYLDSRYAGQGVAMRPATMDDARTLAQTYGVTFDQVPDAFFPSGYRIDHASLIFLTDKNGKVLSFFPDQTPARMMAHELGALP